MKQEVRNFEVVTKLNSSELSKLDANCEKLGIGRSPFLRFMSNTFELNDRREFRKKEVPRRTHKTPIVFPAKGRSRSSSRLIQ